MNSTQCTEFGAILGQSPDGPWPAAAVAHLDSCPPCRQLWHDLDAIRTAGRELGSSEPEPPEYLWTLLRGQLQSEGLIHEAPRLGWFTSWFGFPPRFAMGGAYIALLVIGSSLVALHNDPPSAMRLDGVKPSLSMFSSPLGSELNHTLDGDLERVVASLSKENAPVAKSVRQNLGVVDNLIVLCEKSVREHPDNPMAREYLYGAYQQKATLLEAAMDRTTLENR